MIGKWKWIGDKLKELNINPISDGVELLDLYTQAYDIEYALREIHGNTVTLEFKHCINRIEKSYECKNSLMSKLEYIQLIARDNIYCIACIESRYNCNNCKFAEMYGKCSENDSMYRKFYDSLRYAILQIER